MSICSQGAGDIPQPLPSWRTILGGSHTQSSATPFPRRVEYHAKETPYCLGGLSQRISASMMATRRTGFVGDKHSEIECPSFTLHIHPIHPPHSIKEADGRVSCTCSFVEYAQRTAVRSLDRRRVADCGDGRCKQTCVSERQPACA